MGRVNDWVLGMEEDAGWMSRDVFIRVHGISNVDVFDRVTNDIDDSYYEPDLEAMEEGFYGS